MEGDRSPAGDFFAWFFGAAIIAPAGVAAGVGLMFGFSELPWPREVKQITNLAGKVLGACVLAGLMFGLKVAMDGAPSSEARVGAQLGGFVGLGLLTLLYLQSTN